LGKGKNGTKESKARIIKGIKNLNTLSYTFIPYWSGIFWGVKSGFGLSELVNGDSSIASISELTISGDLTIDLGYILNIERLSEIWLNISIYTGQETVSIQKIDHISNLNLNYMLGLEAGLEYRYYLKIPLFLSLGLDIGMKLSEYDIGYYNEISGITDSGDGTMNMASYYLQLKAGGGYSFTPDLEIYSDISYRYQLFGNSYITENGKVLSQNEMDYIDNRGFEYGGTARLSLGIRFSY